MVRAFVLNSPYPTAPFSTLYLFGRGQDIGFQKAIDNSPRKRHHIRFWAQSLARAERHDGDASFWLNTDRPPDDAPCSGSAPAPRIPASRSPGSRSRSPTRPTPTPTPSATTSSASYETHQTIDDVATLPPGQGPPAERVNRYIADGDVTVANLR